MYQWAGMRGAGEVGEGVGGGDVLKGDIICDDEFFDSGTGLIHEARSRFQ